MPDFSIFAEVACAHSSDRPTHRPRRLAHLRAREDGSVTSPLVTAAVKKRLADLEPAGRFSLLNPRAGDRPLFTFSAAIRSAFTGKWTVGCRHGWMRLSIGADDCRAQVIQQIPCMLPKHPAHSWSGLSSQPPAIGREVVVDVIDQHPADVARIVVLPHPHRGEPHLGRLPSFAAAPLRAELAPGPPGNLQVNLHTDASQFRLVRHPAGCNRVLDGNAHGFEKGDLLVVLPASGCTIDHLAKFRIRLATGQD